jgi:transposase
VIHERLVAEHGFDGHYQRVKVYVRQARARLDQADPAGVGFHRRFEVLPGAQAQVDWGDEGETRTQAGPLHAFSFHMVLSYSRDPFCCFTASQDLATFSRLPPPGVRPLRRGARDGRLRPDQDGGAPPRGPRPGHPAAP